MVKPAMFNNRFIRFLIVGGINTAFGYGVYALLIFLKFHYAVASLLATILGVMFNFKTTGSLVFESKDNRLIFKFVGVYAIIYALNTASLGVFNYFKVDMYLAGAAMLLPMAMVGFVLNKNLVFKG
ncbi:MAG: GtrA family protein [Nitrospirae bacterium]|nr:GtrA family protein [Nitrospirota bacterium]